MRHARRSAATIALGLALAVGYSAAEAGSSPSSQAAPVPASAVAGTGGELLAVQGLEVRLDHRERPAPGPNGAGKVEWDSSWTLSWEPVPGASGYDVFYGTNEGADEEPDEVRDEPSVTVQTAAGTSAQAALEDERRASLLLASSQLLVSVQPRGQSGTGPRSPWFPVGDVPADGRPLGTQVLAGHDH